MADLHGRLDARERVERVADEPKHTEPLLAPHQIEVGIVEPRQAEHAEAVVEAPRLVDVGDATLPAVPEVPELLGVVGEREQERLVPEQVAHRDLADSAGPEAGIVEDAVLHHVERQLALVGQRARAIDDRGQHG